MLTKGEPKAAQFELTPVSAEQASEVKDLPVICSINTKMCVTSVHSL